MNVMLLLLHLLVLLCHQDDEISLGDKVIPKDATVKALKSLGATFNFVDIWLHNFIKNYF